jgi:quercetin dioxygenase-like cupin family protein
MPTKSASETFTGSVWGDPVLPTTDGTTINDVFFAPGARTYWHRHERGQILVVAVGEGLMGQEGGSVRRISAGDKIWIPAGERHWHGATATTALLHLAISLGSTEWLEPVSEEEYATSPDVHLDSSRSSGSIAAAVVAQ